MQEDHISQHIPLLEMTYDAAFVWRLKDGAILYWNDAAERLYGFSSDQALGHNVHQLLATVFPEDYSSVADALAHDGQWEGTLIHTAQSGNQIHINSRMMCEPSSSEAQFIIEMDQDIIDRRGLKQALRESEERFQSLATAIAQVAFITNAKGEMIEDSPSWRMITGQSYRELEGLGWINAIHLDDREQIKTLWTQSIASGKPFTTECRLYRADGQDRWTSMHAIPIPFSGELARAPSGKIREWIVALTDITDKKLAETARRMSEECLQYALDAGSMVTWDWNLTTGFTKRTGPSQALFGLRDGPAEEFIALVHPHDRDLLSEAIERAKRGEAPLDYEFRVTAADGYTMWVSAKAKLRTDPTNGDSYLTGVAMDTTKRRQVKERLKLLDAITEATRTATDSRAGIARATELLGQHLGAVRCAYGELDHHQECLTIHQDWTAEGTPSRVGNYPLNLFGSKALSELYAGHTLIVRDADQELASDNGHEMFDALGIKAAVCCRLLKEDHVLAMIAVHQDVPREWNDDDIALMEEVAARIWAHLERVSAIEALRKSEAHLSSLLEQTAVGVLETDLDGRIIRANDEYCRVLGRSREEILGHYMQNFTHPEDLPRNIELFERAVKYDEAFEMEKRYVQPDGTAVWVNNSVSLISPTGDSTASTILAIVLDITQRKQAEDELIETTNRLQFTLESAEIGDWDLDLTNDTATRSLKHDQCFGYNEPIDKWGFEEFIQRVHPDDKEYVTQQFQKAVTELTSWHFECRVIWPDESTHWIAAHGNIYHVNGRPTRMSGIVFDITERKGHEQALRESEQRALTAASLAESERRRLDAVLEAVPVGIAVTNADGRLHQVNPAHRRLWGAQSPDVQHVVQYQEWKGWWADGTEKHGRPLQPQEWAAARALRGEDAPHDIVEIESFDIPPVRRVMLVSAAPIRDNQGAITGVVAAQMDITDRVKAEEALREADRRKDEFLAMLAHELRNPLAPIGAAAEILRLAHLDEARIKQASAIISRQVKHMTGLVDDLLDVSRVTRGLVTLDKVKLDAKRVIADAVEQVRPLIEARGHRLTVHTPPASAFVLADQKRLVQVMTNLLNNAAKYTPEGGDIVLSVEVDGDHVKTIVTDNGIGMAPVLVERVFELFAQAERNSDRSQGGLGIGLALVRSLVELHGGTVQAHSEGVGKGSTFILCLPQLRAQSDKGGAQPGAVAPVAPASVQKILVVDDNIDAAEMLAMFCEALGHQAFVEHTSQKALERAKLERPDVCLLDIGLPDMDGNELARHLRAQPETAKTALIAVTGYGQEQDRKTALEAGFDHHFVKPLDTLKLAELLNKKA